VRGRESAGEVRLAGDPERRAISAIEYVVVRSRVAACWRYLEDGWNTRTAANAGTICAVSRRHARTAPRYPPSLRVVRIAGIAPLPQATAPGSSSSAKRRRLSSPEAWASAPGPSCSMPPEARGSFDLVNELVSAFVRRMERPSSPHHMEDHRLRTLPTPLVDEIRIRAARSGRGGSRPAPARRCRRPALSRSAGRRLGRA
jgi:hypothetical protein